MKNTTLLNESQQNEISKALISNGHTDKYLLECTIKDINDVRQGVKTQHAWISATGDDIDEHTTILEMVEELKLERLIDKDMKTNYKIETIGDVMKFFVSLLSDHSLSFHPDTPFGDYITSDGKPCFTPAEVIELQSAMDKAIEVCEADENIDIYEIGMLMLMINELGAEYLVKDISGRGETNTVTDKHLIETWDLEEESNDGLKLWQFIIEASPSDEWTTNAIKIIKL